MKALVTGGAGFIGSHLVDALTARGDEVAVVDDLSSGKRSNLDRAVAAGAVLHVADVTDGDTFIPISEAFAPDVVLHLAAQMDVRRSIADPAFDATVNVAGTANALEGARRSGCRKFVFVSTGGAIYGEGDGRPLPLDEDQPALPLSPYGQSKLAAEGYVDLYRRLYGIDGVTLRLGNVYGPRQDPHGEAGVVAIFCGRIRDAGRPTVFGTGRQTRDYIYVADTVTAMLAATDARDPGPFNVGTGKETSVLDLISVLGSAAGREDFEPEIAPARPGEVERISIDPRRASEALGWKAATRLEDGLPLTLESVLGRVPASDPG
jgi:UDP-glucose 4-epimerase